jgi:LCP family protein required for cell wall assembly
MPEKPDYRVYRARGGLLSRLLYRGRDRFEPKSGDPAERPGLLDRLRGGGGAAAPPRERPPLPGEPAPEPRRERRPITWRRVLLWAAIGAAAWILLSFVLFMVSAQVQAGKVSERTKKALDSSGPILTSANNILVLGSDRRPDEPGPGRADTIMLLRYGGGKSARLSIPRDTLADIPGAGRQKINAAYAIGGTPLMIQTVKQFLGIEINHIVEVDFKGFPKFVNAMGGVDMKFDNCLVSRFEGRTWRFHKGKNHLNGRRALAVVRIRKNKCDPSESDLSRARRQQKFIEAVKGRILSPFTFPRLPWVAWRAPRAIRSDMGGMTLLGLYLDTELSGSIKPAILKPIDPGANPLQVSDADKQEAVQKFLDG